MIGFYSYVVIAALLYFFYLTESRLEHEKRVIDGEAKVVDSKAALDVLEPSATNEPYTGIVFDEQSIICSILILICFLFLLVAVSQFEDWNRAAGVDAMVGGTHPEGEEVLHASTDSGALAGI